MASLETKYFSDLKIIHCLFYNNEIPFTGIAVNDGVNGVTSYIKNGEYHRGDAPAKIWPDGYYEWWLHGDHYDDINEWGKALGIYDTDEFTMIKLQWG